MISFRTKLGKLLLLRPTKGYQAQSLFALILFQYDASEITKQERLILKGEC